jgi:hypothetical protein
MKGSKSPGVKLQISKWRWSVLAVPLLLLLLCPGCQLIKTVVGLPSNIVSTVTPKKQAIDPVDLQLELQRFTDDFTTRMAQALDDYAQTVGTEAARVEAMQLKLVGGSALVGIASGPNPSANLLDLVSVTVLTRKTIEDYWIKTTNGSAFLPWLKVSRSLETSIWEIASRVLTPEQANELRMSIDQWYARNPDAQNAFFARPHELTSMVKTPNDKKVSLESVFNLDPMAGLDPAVREVTRTRLFAERAMFTMQRMPFLLRLQTELLAHQLITQPEVQMALTNTTQLSDSADRISRAAEMASKTVTQVPERITAERKAILEALDQQEGKLAELSAQVNQALQSGEKMSTSLNTTLNTFDVLIKRFGVGEPKTNAPPGTNSKPFNILDYGTAAAQVGEMAKEVNALIASVDQTTPRITSLSRDATTEAQRMVNRAFYLGLVLILVLLAGSVLAALVYRLLIRRLTRRDNARLPTSGTSANQQ